VLLRRFISVSIIIHLLIVTGIYFLPKPKQPEKKEFSASLVTPEEVPPPAPPVPARPSAPVLKPRSLPQPPKKEARSSARPSQPPPDISPDRPVVPGEGSDTGAPLPQGEHPASGKAAAPDTGPGTEPAVRPGHSADSTRQGGSLRSKLFDPFITSEIAGKGSAARAGKDDAVTFDTRDYRYAGYMHKLRDKIQSIWVYPATAAAEGKYGDLKIRFTINKDGRLGKVELVRTSGYRVLDDAAIKALKDGEPYWPLPDEWGTESYTILGHFIYSLYGFQQLR